MVIDSGSALLREKAFTDKTGTDLTTLVGRVGSNQPGPAVVQEEITARTQHREGMTQIQGVLSFYRY
jgi:hypothetical protein